MRELDELLLRYLDERYDGAGDSEKLAFCRLLTLSDPVLVSYLFRQAQPEPQLAAVIERILEPTDA